jgi:two-component system phosphate regulon sensor histidine kinase PhoR
VHPLRIILLASLTIALAISAAFAYTLEQLGVADGAILLIAAAVFVAFLVPWAAVFTWAIRRASDLEELADRMRVVAEGGYDKVIADRTFHGEVDDLARLAEELRELLTRQQSSSEEYRQTIQQIVDSMGEGLMALDHKGRVVFANARVSQMFGSSSRLPGRSFLEVVRKQSLVEAVDRALNGEDSIDRTLIRAGGHDQEIEIRVFPVQGSAEIAAVALFIDVTEISRLQRIRKEFLDDFSHEVRTPLAGIRTAAETLERPLTDEDEAKLRAVMLRQVARMERLVSDLSELNRIESGVIELERAEVDLLDLAKEVCDEFRRRGSGAEFDVHGESALVRADEGRIQQVLTNLLDNAVKYGGAAGRVVVEVRRDGRDAVLRVSDEGEGIPAGETERIFHRFYRVDRSRSQSVPGIGLGLAIAKHLVAAHGGTIRAFNRPDRGATFEFRLPISAAALRAG